MKASVECRTGMIFGRGGRKLKKRFCGGHDRMEMK